MRDVINHGTGTFIDRSKRYYYNASPKPYKHKPTPVKKEETTLKKILKKSAIQCFSGMLSPLISGIIAFLYKNFSKNPKETLVIVMYTLFVIFIIIGAILLYCFFSDLINVLQLKKEGQFVEMRSRIGMINAVFACIQSLFSKAAPALSEHIVGKVYKNIDGKIYEIISKPCPICETPPIGTMYLSRKKNSKKYTWICSEQSSHRQDFDYKKKF